MSRKAAKPAPAPHRLPQSGGSFTLTGGALVPVVTSPPDTPDQSPDDVGVKPVSKEA